MNILAFIGQIFNPVKDLISEYIEDPDKANELNYKMFQLQQTLSMQALEYDKALLEAKANIIQAEAKSESWLTANWRPLTMVTFLGLLVSYWLGYSPTGMTEGTLNNVFNLLQIGIGGYVVGRSAEKVLPKIMNK